MDLFKFIVVLILGYLWLDPPKVKYGLRCAFYELQTVDSNLFQQQDLVTIKLLKSVPNRT
jgi:hypothetical protein